VSGASEISNNFTVNGIDNNDEGTNAPAFRPSVDAIQEFKLLTGTYAAEYGRSTGAQVVVITKSGTNAFHGGLFEFVRNQVMDAKNFFTTPGLDQTYKRNQFGGTVGGPIKKDKTFFFFSYEGLRLRNQLALLATVPTPAMIGGDFSSLLAVKPAKVLVDPFTKVAFPGNIIPPTRINSYAKALAAYYPAPVSPTLLGSLPGSNYTLSETRQETVNEYSMRVDHSFSAKDSMYANYNHFDDPSFEPNNSLCGSSLLPKFGCFVGNTTQLAAFSETHIFAPTLVNEVRLGYNRLRQPRINEDNAYPLTPLPGAFFDTNQKNNQGVPNTSVSGFATLGGATNLPQDRADNTFQIIDSLSYIKGKHSLKFGMDLRDFVANNISTSSGRGTLSFTASTAAPTTGYALADLLLGYPTSAGRNPTAPNFYQRLHSYNVYAQDDWKLTSNFTVNLGLRWELNSPLREQHNLLSNFDAITGTIYVAGTGNVGSNVYDYDWNNFGPRVGFAWQPFNNAKTVIRAGFGIFYQAPVIFNSMNGLSSGLPFRNPQTFNSSVASPVTLDNPFPAANAGGTSTFSGLAKNYGTAEINQWNFNIQRELGFDTVLSLGYYASNGAHIPLSQAFNQPLPGPGTTAQVNARRPYPTYGNITLLETEGNSSFNSLQAKLEKRLSHGLTFLTSYTWGKSIDNTPGAGSTSVSSKGGAQNARNLQAERGLSDFDVRHRLVISPVYNLPFGKGREFLTKGWASQVVGGWELSGIVTWQTGHPITPYVSANISNTFNNSDRPNVVGNANDGPKTVQQWFNTAAFVLPASGTFGNAGRNIIAGPGLVQADISLARNFQFKEKLRLQFRAEAFDALNHPNFNLPAATVDSGNFGQITSAADPRQIQLGLKLNF
jgi:hypothetical protein